MSALGADFDGRVQAFREGRRITVLCDARVVQLALGEVGVDEVDVDEDWMTEQPSPQSRLGGPI